MDPKEKLIKDLLHQHYVMLKPSAVAGVGVFAIRDIPSGCRDIFSIDPGDWICLDKKEVEALPNHSRLLVENYCLFDKQQYYVPAHGFKTMDLSLYLNHSDQPNLKSVDEGAFFETIRDIREGEELFLDYGEICEYDSSN
ncbi:MAG: SET domain-containing protein [Saprospiraceae bacterium]|nr:SET domain-containing protein [Saprospiraceae bacterium]